MNIRTAHLANYQNSNGYGLIVGYNFDSQALGPTVDGSGSRHLRARAISASARVQRGQQQPVMEIPQQPTPQQPPSSTRPTVRFVRGGQHIPQQPDAPASLYENFPPVEEDMTFMDDESFSLIGVAGENDEHVTPQGRGKGQVVGRGKGQMSGRGPTPVGPRRKDKSKDTAPPSREGWEYMGSATSMPRDGSVLPSLTRHMVYPTIFGLGGPSCETLLRCYPRVWLGEDLGSWLVSMSPGARSLIRSTGLDHLHLCVHDHVDRVLVHAFLERWQPDTNSFHLPFGEMSIFLHDVFFILGLPVDGKAIHSVDADKVTNRVKNLWSEEVCEMYKSCHKVKTVHIKNALEALKSVHDDDRRVAEGWLTIALGCLLFIDKNSNRWSPYEVVETADIGKLGSYSWGSAVLAYLYRQLGKASRLDCPGLSGCVYLLQSWIYEHFPQFRPGAPVGTSRRIPLAHYWTAVPAPGKQIGRLQQIRRALDLLTVIDVTWDPYADVGVQPDISLYRGLIGYRKNIEPHMPDRCIRQFGYLQNVPFSVIKPKTHYRGPNVEKYNVPYSDDKWDWDWDNRDSRVTPLPRPVNFPGEATEDYHSWYATTQSGASGSSHSMYTPDHEWFSKDSAALQPSFEVLDDVQHQIQ